MNAAVQLFLPTWVRARGVSFVVASWEEHLRQHRDRLTGADRDFDAKARGLSDPPSQTRHLIAAEG